MFNFEYRFACSQFVFVEILNISLITDYIKKRLLVIIALILQIQIAFSQPKP